MTPATKRTISREWLILLGFLLVGFLVLPTGLMLIAKGDTNLTEFYSALFSRRVDDRLFTWAVAIDPYALYLLIRSVRWSLRTLGWAKPHPQGSLAEEFASSSR